MAEITATPNPVDPGAELVICYVFDESLLPVELRLTWTPAGPDDPTGWEVTPKEPCETITVPQDKETLLIEDLSGAAGDEAVSVNP